MWKKSYSKVMFALMVMIVGIQMGCGSSQSVQYKTLASVKVAVDTSMNVWADRVIDGKTTLAQEAKVRAAFISYQDAYAIAVNAAVTNQAPPTALVLKTSTDLLNLLTSFGVSRSVK